MVTLQKNEIWDICIFRIMFLCINNFIVLIAYMKNNNIGNKLHHNTSYK